MTIPASDIVSVNPGVISAGGSALDLNGLILTADTAVPLGTVQPFSSADAVGQFFGNSSTEKALADIYFLSYDNSTLKPASLLFAQYNAAVAAAYLRSASLADVTLAQLKTLSGVLAITVDGVLKTSSAINLSGATSFANAATIIAAAFTGGPTVTYDTQRSAFVFTSGTTGPTSTISYATGSLSAGLRVTQATSAVISAGAAAATPGGAMASIIAVTQNWAAFMTTFEPTLSDKLLFAAWVVSRNNRFAYVAWDTDANATVANNTTALGPQVKALSLSGVVPVYQSPAHSAFILSIAASLDFKRTNGRTTFAFRAQSGLASTVTDQTTANILEANGYNFYGAYATANMGFTFLYPGQVGGNFKWLDTYFNEIYLNSQLQLAIMILLTNSSSVPYNVAGRALIEAACADPITQALNFGAIRAGVTLSALQKAQVNTQAGLAIDNALTTRGWYLQVLDATSQVRGVRGSPPCTFWYMDGGSVQRLTLASIVVQ